MKVFLFAFIFAGITACKPSAPDTGTQTAPVEETTLYKEVMAIHDEVMPKTSVLHEMKASLKKLETETNKDVVMRQIMRIERADEAMMAWMDTFEVPEDPAAAEPYLLKEKERIQAVADSINLALAEAEAALSALTKN